MDIVDHLSFFEELPLLTIANEVLVQDGIDLVGIMEAEKSNLVEGLSLLNLNSIPNASKPFC